MHEDRVLNLRYWRELVLRQRTLLLACTVGVASLAAVFSLLQTPEYVSTCKLYVSRQKVQTLSFTDIFTDERGRSSDLLLTQIEILRSDPILQRAVQDLEDRGVLLFADEAPPASGWSSFLDRLPGRGPDLPLTADDKRRSFASKLRQAITARPVPGNAFLAISVTSTKPELAAGLANAVANAYVRNDAEMRRRSADEAISWLSKKVDEQRRTLLQTEKNLRGFRPVPAEEREGPSDLETQEIARLQQALVEIRLAILQVEASDSLRPKGEAKSPPAMPNAQATDFLQAALRQRLQQELVDLTLSLQDMRRRYGERHPDVLKAIDREAALKTDLEALGPAPLAAVAPLVAAAPGAAGLDIDTLRAQERALKSSLDRAMSANASKGDAGTRYAILKREVELGRSLYNEMLSRLNELTISAGVDASRAEVFEAALPGASPVSPDHQRSVLLGLAAGLLLGLAVAAVRDHLDQSVRDPAHAHDLLHAPVLGVIPYQGREGWAKLSQGSRPPHSLAAPGSPAEAYRVLRSHIEGGITEGEAGILLLTSAVPGEGKTTTAANLAVAFAESGRRVLLVDGDLRRPTLGRYFHLDQGGQLGGVLRGDVAADQAVRPTEVPGLDFLGGRAHTDVPDGVQLSRAIRDLFEWAGACYDRVIVDTPVAMAVPGVAEMARAGATVLLVHRPGWVPAQVLRQVREHLTLSRAQLSGVVLNGVRPNWVGARYPLVAYYGSSRRTPSTLADGKEP
jgi:capsular exopolysaccharide synthesis family protein